MKLNFSIDVILGNGVNPSNPPPERKRPQRDEGPSVGDYSYTTPGNFTVEWRPPVQKRIKTEFPTAGGASESPTRFPFMSHFAPSRGGSGYAGRALGDSLAGAAFPGVGCNVNVRVSAEERQHNSSFSSECHSSSDDSEVEGRLHGHGDVKNTSTDSETKTASKRGGARVGRRLFTGFQILELESAFSVKTYLTRTERAFLAQKVNLTECQIKTWFQNRRTKEKRRGPCSDDDATDGSTEEAVDSSSPAAHQPKASRVPGHGIQVRPTYGPPDRHLRAAIMDFLKRKKTEDEVSPQPTTSVH